jgi:hypothetical protein
VKRQVPIAAVLSAVIVIVAVIGYMALIRPKRAEVTKLNDEVAKLETTLKTAEDEARRVQELASRGGDEKPIRVADLVKLAKAMPDDADMAGTLVELGSIASGAGVKFVSIQPLAPVATESYRRVPIQLTFDGNYYDLLEVLYGLRDKVRVRDGRLQADGRLFSLDQFDLHESSAGFPQIEALLTVSTYLHGVPGADTGALAGVPALPVEVAGQQPTETIQSDPSKAPSLPSEQASN